MKRFASSLAFLTVLFHVTCQPSGQPGNFPAKAPPCYDSQPAYRSPSTVVIQRYYLIRTPIRGTAGCDTLPEPDMHFAPTQLEPYPDTHSAWTQPVPSHYTHCAGPQSDPRPDESAGPGPGQEFAYACCGAGLLACLMALLIAYRRKSRKYTELLNSYHALETRFAQLSNDSERSSAESTYLCDALARQLQRFQELLGKAFKASNQKNFVREFKAHAASIRNDKNLFADLRYVVDMRFGRLTDHLRTAHPDLTEYELDLLCMLRLGFSFDCIRLLHCHENIYSLYSRRTKIHKKLGLPLRLRLEEYLSELGRQSQAGIPTPPDKITNH